MGKKLLSFILALALLFSLTAAFAEEEREFVVGNTTQMKGDFLGELFGNNTADIDVRALIHGYDLVHWDEEQGVYRFDPSVIAELNVDLDAEGNKVFTFTLCDDLYWSDGTAITAWDYAFSILLTISPEVATIGGRTYSMPQLLGSAEYLGGALPYLPGVGVTDERTLVITVDRNYLPFFYEVGLLSCVPYPFGAIAPGCLVYSDGEDRNWNAPAKNDENKTRYGMGI